MTLSQWLDAGVAFGTLALAGVTAWLAIETRKVARESVRSRLDAEAPRVAIRLQGPDRLWWNRSRILDAELHSIPMDRSYIVPIQQDELILMRAEALISNEGDSTVIVQVDGSGEFVRGAGGFHVELGGADAYIPTKLSDGRYAIAPRAHALLVVTPGKSVVEWIEGGEDSVFVDLLVMTQVAAGVVDRWRIELAGQPVEQNPMNIGEWRLRPPATARAILHAAERRYPDDAVRGS